MANRHIDNFGHYAAASANLSLLYSSVSSCSFTTDRWGVANAAVRVSASGGTLRVALGASPATAITGFAWKTAFAGGGTSNFLNCLDSGAVVHTCLGVNLSGQIVIGRGVISTVLATSTRSINTTQWSFVELKTLIANAGGTAELKVNEVVWASFTGDTQNGGVANVSSVEFKGGSSTQDFCDWYINDTSGAVNTDYWGDTRVMEVYPDGAGASTQFTIGGTTPAATNWQSVNGTNPNENVTFVESSTVGHKDLYAFTDLTGSPTIRAARLLVSARSDDGGARGLAGTCTSGATASNGTTLALTTSYVYAKALYETDPNTAAAWTVANLNAATFGQTIIS